MLATMEAVSVLDRVDSFTNILIQSECAIAYREAKTQMDNDPEAQKLIRSFQDLKERYEEVQRFGHYHPDYKTVMKQMRDLKRELDTHPSIARYKQCEDNLQSLLTEIAQAIGGAVSEQIKIPTGNPFFDNASSCSGGCGSGGSCGCKTS
ncbi:YlbF family regulator [Bacillaceae bacterium SIJ1]|uniref:YlbF family regulator n=1 Tax=Litoribacterium kuwaitense TaxID=1398745 RepID=UPI0013ED2323|nr:YlbF family regulator [Litoribacterium kuwaitense]NGP44364.1 YlbF family regulator [Litoribacterium kuwaitense]